MSCELASANHSVTLPEQLFLQIQRTMPWTIAAGNVLPAGTFLGLPTGGTELIPSLQTAADGSQNPMAVLHHAIDTTGAATSTAVVMEGIVNPAAALPVNASWTEDQLREALEAGGQEIYLRAPIWSGVG